MKIAAAETICRIGNAINPHISGQSWLLTRPIGKSFFVGPSFGNDSVRDYVVPSGKVHLRP